METFCKGRTARLFLFSFLITGLACMGLGTASAKDIDIYDVSAKNNSYILMDNSGSMAFGVYEAGIDYGAMYDYFITLHDDPNNPSATYIWDTVNNWAAFFQKHKEMRKIFLWKGRIGVTVANLDGTDVAFTGDSGDPDYLWYSNDLVDTNTYIDESGNLVYDGSGTQRLTVDNEGHILFDGARLPLGKDIKLHDHQTLYDGSLIDNGFGGLMNAPGNYFSGYEGVTAGSLNVAESGDDDVYFFVTGNWVNMQAMYNLHYVDNPDPNTAKVGDAAWVHEQFPISQADWSLVPKHLQYPDTGDPTYNGNGVEYDVNLTETATARKIVHPGAQQITVHFSSFDVNPAGSGGNKPDYLNIYNSEGDLVVKYNNDSPPPGGWSAVVTGDTVDLRLVSGKADQGTGYVIDSIRVTYIPDSYLMQSRLDVGKDAMLYTVEEFRGKMNWGFGSFNYNGTVANGATIGPALNANDNDDLQREAIAQAVRNVQPMYGTPLGEALQDIFETGYYGHRNTLEKLDCRKNYVIVLTDGFPSGDEDWTRIGSEVFTDADGDKWTADPYQYSNPPDNYYDDVAHYLYTHSWLDHSEVPDPANSYYNVTPHQIAFGAVHPLLQDAAEESGGEYITAYNKTQLVAAFYSLALMMSEAVSFTAPVVSVDAANKMQNGNDLYLGLFLPQDGSTWIGNVKKFVLGDGSTERPDPWMFYDGDNQPAINGLGEFLDNTAGFWDDDIDNNDSDNYGAADVTEDGAGGVMLDKLKADMAAQDYWARPIYTLINGVKTKLHRDYISPADLGVADDATRDKLINFIYGYTYDADPADGSPVALRDWPLGSIIHSEPVVVDYYGSKDPVNLPNDMSVVTHRYIVIGSNDGMFHVFNDTPGSGGGEELLAFIPPDLLPRLQRLPVENIVEMVDGFTTSFRRDNQPKYLIFGERRGGNSYWCLDVEDTNPANWSVQWQYTNPEIAQTWSKVEVARIPVNVALDGTHTFKDVIIFSGGFDEEEDNYPEPFKDIDNSGSPYSNGTIDKNEWDKTDSAQDVNNNDLYDTHNLDMNEYGRGIFIVDIDDPTNTYSTTVYDPNDLSSATTVQILPFSVTYGAADVTTGNIQTRTDMKWCFPASPGVIFGTLKYFGRTGLAVTNKYEPYVLIGLYVPDIYGNVFRVSFDFKEVITNRTGPVASWQWKVTSHGFKVDKIFSANPASYSASGQMNMGDDASDYGRKTYYSPSVSWGGTEYYFSGRNYYFPEWSFLGKDKIASLFIGTGDREHPTYTMTRNRFYAIYDDSTVGALKIDPDTATVTDTAVVSTITYSEDDLLNITCNELGEGTTTSESQRSLLRDLLFEDATYDNAGTLELENGINENDAKGWYIVLEDQAYCANTGTLDNNDTSASDNHYGEKILSEPVLFDGALYFTSYQPAMSDPCNPTGNGFAYALEYDDGSAVYDMNQDGRENTVQDRYYKVTNIFGIPSGFNIIQKDGDAAAMAMMGGQVVGGGGPPSPGNPRPPFQIRNRPSGLELYYWREGNSMQQ